MYVGIQFEAPEGYGSFCVGIRYYFAGDRPDGHVLIIWFGRHKKAWRVHLMMPLRSDFEAAFVGESPKLRRLPVQFCLPPWLEANEGLNFDELEAARPKPKGEVAQTYREQVEGRLLKISPALERYREIFDAKDPLREISKTAYEGEDRSAKHPHRLQVWFFAYLLHGQNVWALKQPTVGYCGTWSRRDDKHLNAKYGRESLAGASFGWSSAPLRNRILKSYLARCGLGTTMRDIHRRALLEDFGCEAIEVADGEYRYVHPQNLPFPSYGQFRYVVVGELGLEQVRTTIYGAHRLRNAAPSNEGNYTEQYANILEGFEVDAYYTERPTAMFSSAPAEPLSVARGVCVTTGAVVGVGFALGAETGEAYRSMLFCMAVSKDYIAWLYGIPAGHLKWIMQGLPANFISDRGPAGHRSLAERLEQAFPIKSIVPSHAGQSKASVESKHPRDVQVEGGPSFRQSDLDVMQMVKREVYRAASVNHETNIARQLDDAAILEFNHSGRVATPHHYWQYLDERLRTCARSISLEDAVRAFWTPIDLEVDCDGVRHRHKHFTSDEFRGTGILRHLERSTTLSLKGYVLSLVVRCLWVEVGGRLIQVEVKRRSRIDIEDASIPDSDLARVQTGLATLESRTRTSAEAAVGKAQADFASATGKGWHDGRRQAGRPKAPSGTVALETKVIKGTTKQRRAA